MRGKEGEKERKMLLLSCRGREARARARERDEKNIILNPAGTRRTDNPRGLRPRFRDRAKERALLFARFP